MQDNEEKDEGLDYLAMWVSLSEEEPRCYQEPSPTSFRSSKTCDFFIDLLIAMLFLAFLVYARVS